MQCRSDCIFFALSFVLVRCPVLLWSLPVFFSFRGCPRWGRCLRYRCALQCLRHGVAPSVQTAMFHYAVRIHEHKCSGLLRLTRYIILSILRHYRGVSPHNILKRHTPCNTAQMFLRKFYIHSLLTDGDRGRRYAYLQPRPARNKATPNKFVMAFSVGVAVL